MSVYRPTAAYGNAWRQPVTKCSRMCIILGFGSAVRRICRPPGDGALDGITPTVMNHHVNQMRRAAACHYPQKRVNKRSSNLCDLHETFG